MSDEERQALGCFACIAVLLMLCLYAYAIIARRYV